MTRTVAVGLSCWSLVLLAGCGTSRKAAEDSSQGGTVTAAADSAAGPWRSLFDGQSTAGWRGYRTKAAPPGWRIEEGALTRADSNAGDLITTEKFGDFELTLDWKIAPGGNSGIMYRVTEDAEHSYETGPEMQVLDDAKHADGQFPVTSAGALYGLYPAQKGVVKPAGEWNAARIVARGNHIEHWLNGVKIVNAEIGSPDWTQRVESSKFAVWPGFAKAREGYIALQDHGDRVQYRNIRIRALNTPPAAGVSP
jgi:hypothetical protein